MNGYRLLIVHPDPEGREALARQLREDGRDVVEAGSGPSAARLLAERRFDAVLMVVEAEDPDALELLAFARRHWERVPVALLFSGPPGDRAMQALKMGAAVLAYPPSRSELNQALRDAEVLAASCPAARRPDDLRSRDFGRPARPRSGDCGPCPRSHPDRDGKPHANGSHERPDSPSPLALPGLGPLRQALEVPERQIIQQALWAFRWNKVKTAGALGIDRATLYKKMKKYGLLDEPGEDD